MEEEKNINPNRKEKEMARLLERLRETLNREHGNIRLPQKLLDEETRVSEPDNKAGRPVRLSKTIWGA